MKTLATLAMAALLAGCSTLNRYGIGGDPLLMCRKGEAFIDDKLAGSDAARLSALRRFADADPLCTTTPKDKP